MRSMLGPRVLAFYSAVSRRWDSLCRPALISLGTLLCAIVFTPSIADAIISQSNQALAEADPGGWSTTMTFRGDTTYCTSTLVGPQTVITAASCLGDARSAAVKMQDKNYDLVGC